MTAPRLRPFQIELKASTHQAWNQGARNVVMQLATGGGKCLGRGTPVLMFDGSIRAVEDVRIGDRLMGPDSAARLVLSTCTGREELYRVVPTKGEPYVVNASHILSLQRTQTHTDGTAPYPSQRRGGEIANISVREYLKKSATWWHQHKGWRVGVDFPEARLPYALPPYLLGVWLGDGHSVASAITTMDDEIVAEIGEYVCARGLRLIRSPAGGASFTYSVSSASKEHGSNDLRSVLKRLGVWGNKHIPLEYKRSSRAQRLEILAGLIDTDGHYTGKGFDFISVRKVLADDVAYLARSLGFAAYVTRAMKSCNGGPKAEYWRLNISGDIDEIPCCITRKRARPRLQKKSVLRTGIRLEPLGEGDYFGFEIDGDSLFLLGDFTVTHNTRTFADIVTEEQGFTCILVHRTELLSQISTTLAGYDVRHNIIGSDATRRAISRIHVEELGRSWVDANARVIVASIDTLVRQDCSAWAPRVTLWVVDEGHHVVLDNKWHRGIAQFTHPAVRGLLPTATPIRADGKGLGTPALGGHGVADVMVQGPPMRWLIEAGYLCDYRIICPKSHAAPLKEVSASGDWSSQALREASEATGIIGDMVQAYLTYGRGKTGALFSTDVETAGKLTHACVAAGINAACLTGKTDDYLRRSILKRLARRELDLIVAVDIISEGFDLPALEYGGFGRWTNSYAMYAQQFGRFLRTAEGKGKAVIVDHVGNVIRHEGPPDKPKRWSLASTCGSGGKTDTDIPHRVCDECLSPYERFHRCCPFCGHYPIPAARSSPAHVEGDMEELDPEVLAALRAAVDESEQDLNWWRSKYAAEHWTPVIAGAQLKHHAARLEAQPVLRVAMATWGGAQKAAGLTDPAIQRAFYLRFGISTLEAMALHAKEARNLTERIQAYVG